MERSSRHLLIAGALIAGAAAVAVAAPACGDAGGEESGANDDEDGRVAAYVVDAPPEEPAPGSGAETGPLRGEMVANYIISVYSEDGAWVDLGRRAELRVPLQDPSGASLAVATTDVPSGRYTRVRATLCHASVRLRAGSRVAGRAVEEGTDLHITETGDVIVEREVAPVRVAPGTELRLSVDLRSSRWITGAAIRDGAVSIPRLEGAVEVSVVGVRSPG